MDTRSVVVARPWLGVQGQPRCPLAGPQQAFRESMCTAGHVTTNRIRRCVQSGDELMTERDARQTKSIKGVV